MDTVLGNDDLLKYILNFLRLSNDPTLVVAKMVSKF